MTETEVDSCVKGYYVYKALWTPIVGEQLICTREPTNPEDRYTVAVVIADVVVGHLPRKFSRYVHCS